MDKQSWILIALELDYPDVLKLCNTNKNINSYICKNPYFWIGKLKKDYDFVFTGKPSLIRNPKDFYFYLANMDKYDPDIAAAKLLKQGNDDLAKYLLLKYKASKLQRFFVVWGTAEMAGRLNNLDMINFLEKEWGEYYKDLLYKSIVSGALRGGNKDLVDEYFPKIFDMSYVRSLFAGAIRAKGKRMVDYLLNKLNRDNSQVQEFLSKNEDMGPMWYAARYGKLDLLKHFEELGIGSYKDALDGAVNSPKKETIEIIKYLLTKSIPIKDKYNALALSINRSENKEETQEVREMYSKIVSLFLAQGLDYKKGKQLSKDL